MNKLASEMSVIDYIRYRIPAVDVADYEHSRWCEQVVQETAKEVWHKDFVTRTDWELDRIKQLLAMNNMGSFLQADEIANGLFQYIYEELGSADTTQEQILREMESTLQGLFRGHSFFFEMADENQTGWMRFGEEDCDDFDDEPSDFDHDFWWYLYGEDREDYLNRQLSSS